MIKEAIIKVAKKEDLTYEESKAVMNEIMDGETSQVQTAAYLTVFLLRSLWIWDAIKILWFLQDRRTTEKRKVIHSFQKFIIGNIRI